MDRILTSRDTAKMLGIQMQTLANWRFAGIGPKHSKSGESQRGRVIYLESDVQKYISDITKDK